jgi:Zn-finger nucleic acid-binding protein
MFIVLLILIASGVMLLLYGIFSYTESITFNKGMCPHCNIRWEHFDCDSQGGRGYSCPRCGKTIWISYPNVDSIFLKEEYEKEIQKITKQYDDERS